MGFSDGGTKLKGKSSKGRRICIFTSKPCTITGTPEGISFLALHEELEHTRLS
jgi:hypothetical protein